MSEENHCPQCGAVLPAQSPQGLCPGCLLKWGLESQTGGEETASQAGAADRPPPAPEEIAAHFPDLEILELVGRGGMGVVYKARQKRLDRLVALKILAPKVGQDPAFAERFAREARAMAMLSHPHVVAVYDSGQTPLAPPGKGAGGEGSLYYFLMEFVDGVNLRRLLDTGKLAPEEALAIVPQICEALQYAHDHGVVHRDIKPENVLLDKEGRVKIADFGIAKLVGKEAKDLTLTGAGQIVGTPQYMAPEQIEHPLQVDHRADIYSLGVVFYQMLTGELPIGRFAPPSKKVEIDVRLDEVVLRALEKEPQRRYQQAGEIRTQVETIARTPGPGPADEAQGSGSPPRMSKTALAGAVAGGPLFLVVVLAVGGIALGMTASVTLLLSLLSPILVLLLAMAIGVPMLGYVALNQIRRSAGRLYGLELALFDLVAFPLLALDAAIAALGMLAVRAATGGPGGAVALFSIVVACVVVDVAIVRWAWRAVSQPPAGAPSADQSGRAARKPTLAVATLVLTFCLGVLGLAFLLRSWMDRVESAQARISIRIFETDAKRVGELAPGPTRQPGQLQVRIATGRNEPKTAEVRADVLARLLADGADSPGLLEEQVREGYWWPQQAIGSHYFRRGKVAGDGHVDGSLAVWRQKGVRRLRAEFNVLHGMNSEILGATFGWEGNVPPPNAARAFFIPFSRTDGTARYLVIALEVRDATENEGEISKPAAELGESRESGKAQPPAGGPDSPGQTSVRIEAPRRAGLEQAERKRLAGTWKVVDLDPIRHFKTLKPPVDGARETGALMTREEALAAANRQPIVITERFFEPGVEYALDPTKTPKTIDLLNEGKTIIVGIYDLQGDRLRIRADSPPNRPKSFDRTGDGDSAVLEVLERVATTPPPQSPVLIGLDGELWSAPLIQSAIGNKGQISGLTDEQASEIADVLNAGSLPVRLRLVEPRPGEPARAPSASERDGANQMQTPQPIPAPAGKSGGSHRKLVLRLEKGGKVLADGKAFSGDPMAILQRIRDDAALQVSVEGGEGVPEEALRGLRQLVEAAEKQRDPRSRELWEQIAQRQDANLRNEALAKLRAMLASGRNADHDQAMRTLQKVQDVPFDRAPLLSIVRKLIADRQRTAFTRAIAAVQLANLGGGKDDIPVIAAMADDPDSFVRKAVASALYNLDPKGEHPSIAPAIEKLLSDKSGDAGGVVHHTIKALWGRPVSAAAERRLIDLSKQPGPFLSSGIAYDAVYYALSTRPLVSRPVAERLAELALSPDAQSLAGRALWGLSHHPAPKDARDFVVGTLVRILDDTLDAGLRQDCIFGLGLHGGAKAIKRLEAIAASDENLKLREQAKAALNRARPDGP